MRAFSFVFFVFLSTMLSAGTDDVQEDPSIYYLDPFDVSVTSLKGTQQSVQFGIFESHSKQMKPYINHTIHTFIAPQLRAKIKDARKQRKKLCLNALKLKTNEKEFLVDNQNLDEVWTISDRAIDPEY